MPNRWITAGIILFWATMSTLLARRELVPYWFASPGANLSAVANRLNLEPVFWKVLYQHQQIGRVRTQWRRLDEQRLQFQSDLQLRHLPWLAVFQLLGVSEKLSCSSEFDLGPTGTVERLSMRLAVGKFRVDVRGTRTGDVLDVVFRSGGFQYREQLYCPQDGMVGSSLTPFDRLPNLRLGQRWSYRVVNPLRRTSERVECVVVKEQVITWRGQPVPTTVIEQSYGHFRAKCWVAADGRVLRQELPLGMEPIVLELE